MENSSKYVVNSETTAADLVDNFSWDGSGLEPGVALALSGGGFRAMLFHAGALIRLNELGLLSRISRISSVSGGSIAAAFLASIWRNLKHSDTGEFVDFKQAYVDPLLSFSQRNVDVLAVIKGLLPWSSAAKEVANYYDRYLLGGVTLQDLPDAPRFVFCATNLQTGVLWRFSKPYAGDYIVGRLDSPNILLSQAAAASSAFPPFLSPLKLSLSPEAFEDWSTTLTPLISAKDLAHYRSRILLTDGGVYDNHGLEPVIKRYTTILVSDGGAPFGRTSSISVDWLRQLRRVLDITDNQVRALRRRDLIARFNAGNLGRSDGKMVFIEEHFYERTGAYWGIDTSPQRVAPVGALHCSASLVNSIARVSTRLAKIDAFLARQIINWGYAICDRCVRTYYIGPVPLNSYAPEWPFTQAAL